LGPDIHEFRIAATNTAADAAGIIDDDVRWWGIASRL
jgi:hypothetical protein